MHPGGKKSIPSKNINSLIFENNPIPGQYFDLMLHPVKRDSSDYEELILSRRIKPRTKSSTLPHPSFYRDNSRHPLKNPKNYKRRIPNRYSNIPVSRSKEIRNFYRNSPIISQGLNIKNHQKRSRKSSLSNRNSEISEHINDNNFQRSKSKTVSFSIDPIMEEAEQTTFTKVVTSQDTNDNNALQFYETNNQYKLTKKVSNIRRQNFTSQPNYCSKNSLYSESAIYEPSNITLKSSSRDTSSTQNNNFCLQDDQNESLLSHQYNRFCHRKNKESVYKKINIPTRYNENIKKFEFYQQQAISNLMLASNNDDKWSHNQEKTIDFEQEYRKVIDYLKKRGKRPITPGFWNNLSTYPLSRRPRRSSLPIASTVKFNRMSGRNSGSRCTNALLLILKILKILAAMAIIIIVIVSIHLMRVSVPNFQTLEEKLQLFQSDSSSSSKFCQNSIFGKRQHEEENILLDYEFEQNQNLIFNQLNKFSLLYDTLAYNDFNFEYNNPRDIWPSFHYNGLTEYLKWKLNSHMPKKEVQYNKLHFSNSAEYVAESTNRNSNFDNVKIKTEEIQVIWLGHSSFLVQMYQNPSSKPSTILIDPNFSKTDNLPNLPSLDLLLISNSDPKNLHFETIRKIITKFPEITIIMPEGVEKYLEKQVYDYLLDRKKSIYPSLFFSQNQMEDIQNLTRKMDRIRARSSELLWWEPIIFGNIKVTSVPSQYRGHNRQNLYQSLIPWHQDQNLWSGYLIENLADQTSLYFASDTGYAPLFKEIKNTIYPKNLTVSIIPIGNYQPRWLMSPYHLSPEEAVQAHLDLNTRNSVASHFSTFEDDYRSQIDSKLAKILQRQKNNNHQFGAQSELEYFKKRRNVRNFIVQEIGEVYSYTPD